MTDVNDAIFQDFTAGCRRAAVRGLIRCSSGNVSYRLDAERMLISGSRTWLADIRPDQVALCRLADGQPLNDVRPSVEIGFHAGILRRRPDVNVVLHFQTPFATTLACRRRKDIDYNVLPEIAYYIGPIATVAYFTPGSPELARAVTAALAEYDLAMLDNHGQVTVGVSYDDAIQKAVFFELACEIIVRNGDDVQTIAPRPEPKISPSRPLE